MVLVCLPSDVVFQHLPSYLRFSYLGHGVSLHGCSSKAQLLLLTLVEGYLLTAASLDLACGVAPLGPPAPVQQPLLLTLTWGISSWPLATPALHNRSKVRCCKEQYCIGTCIVRSMNQGKLEVVKQEMGRVNVDILGTRELKWTGMGEFNSGDHYIYYCGQESLRRNGVAIIVNKRV